MESTTFNRIREIVFEHSGISLKKTKEAMVSARIGKRMRARGIDTYEQYVNYLDQDTNGGEITHLLDVIATNVTSFFRERQHFDFLKDTVRSWLASSKSKIRIWSAAASTGEEPLSIAMTLQEALGARRVDYKILATDISTHAITCAKQGIYDAAQMDTVPEEMRRRYFLPIKTSRGTGYKVRDELTQNIVYRRINLSQPPFPMRSQLDIVFCRNVMIYFDEVTRINLLDEIHRQLLPGGYLLTGHAESLNNMKTKFAYIQPTIYRKKTIAAV